MSYVNVGPWPTRYVAPPRATQGFGELVGPTEFIRRGHLVNADIQTTDEGFDRAMKAGQLSGPTFVGWKGFRNGWSQYYSENVQNIPFIPKFTDELDAYQRKNAEWIVTLSAEAKKPIIPGPPPFIPADVPPTLLPKGAAETTRQLLTYVAVGVIAWYGYKAWQSGAAQKALGMAKSGYQTGKQKLSDGSQSFKQSFGR